MRIDVLGQVRMTADDGSTRPFPSGRVGRLLEMTLLRPNQRIPFDKIVTVLWPGVDLATAERRLRVTATRLRRLLTGDVRLEWNQGGYRLTIPTHSMDRLRAVTLGQRALAGDRTAARRALELYRGEPYQEFAASPELDRQRNRLLALRERLQAVASGSTGTLPDGTPVSVPAPDGPPLRRPRLLDRLPAAGDVRLVAVVAPSGYGKTVLLAQWADGQVRVGWREMQTADNDPDVFWASVRGALGDATGTDHDPRSPEPHVDTVDRLVNHLVDMGAPVSLVLDDLHRVTNPEIHTQLRRFVDRAPEDVTVAVASRRSLPFPTGRLQATGGMVAIGPADLRFTPGETERALHAADERRRDPAHARVIHETTLGWPAATIELAAEIPVTAPERLRASQWRDALQDSVDEMLEGLTGELADLMVETAHLVDLDPGVCGAVLGREVTGPMLASLADDHGLLIRHGNEFRHHPLLASILIGRRGEPIRRTDPHAEAARRHLDGGRPIRAFDHAAASGDHDLLVETFPGGIERAVARGDADAVRRWVQSVPPPLASVDRSSRPAVLLVLALLSPEARLPWLVAAATDRSAVATLEAVDLLRTGRCHQALAAVARARSLLADAGGLEPEGVTRWLSALVERECRALLAGDDELHHPETALPADPEWAPYPWLGMWALGQRALRALVGGRLGLARALLERAAAGYGELHPSWVAMTHGSICLTRSLLDAVETSRHDAGRTARSLETVAHRGDVNGWAATAVLARYGLSAFHRRTGDHPSAAEVLADAEERRRRLPPMPFLVTMRDRIDDIVQPPAADGVERLTPAERAILARLGSNLSVPEIAAALYLSVHTVRAHIRSIYRKLGVHNRAEALAAIPRPSRRHGRAMAVIEG